MNWKTIKKDGYPKPGTFVLVKTVHQYDQWSDFRVYFFGKHEGFPENAFWLYDLMIRDYWIEKYCEISE